MDFTELIRHMQMDMGNHVDYCVDQQCQKGTIKPACICQFANLWSKVALQILFYKGKEQELQKHSESHYLYNPKDTHCESQKIAYSRWSGQDGFSLVVFIILKSTAEPSTDYIATTNTTTA